MISVTLPSYMALQDWADQVCLDLDTVGAAPKLTDAGAWQDWAVQFLNNPTLGRNLPDPYGFTEWREWAERFCQALA